MRTNIVLQPTKKAIVDEALRTLIRVKKQERILSLRGKIRRQGDLDQMRSGRHHGGHR